MQRACPACSLVWRANALPERHASRKGHDGRSQSRNAERAQALLARDRRRCRTPPMKAALREWWSGGSWPARIAVVALGGLFLVRAGYALPAPVDRHLYLSAAQALRAGQVLENPNVNTWPPTFALFALPLAWVTDVVGDLPMHYVWALLQLAALAALTWFGARALDVRASVGAVAV